MKKNAIVPLQITLLALAVSQACAQEQKAALETVVVQGIRASAQSSVAVKKNAMEVVDSITAEDIGKLSGMYEDSTMSARVTYTWRSDQVLFGVSASPMDGRYIGAYGILDAAFNYNLTKDLTLSAFALNILNRGLNRYVGEPGTYATGLERQHYDNGRAFSLGLRYAFK